MFSIIGRYSHADQEEELDTADTFKEAMYLANEYRIAFGSDWMIWVEDCNKIQTETTC